jgi:hypothetical protein
MTIGGLHYDDFMQALENPPNGYALTGFMLERDHHWRAIYTLDNQFR